MYTVKSWYVALGESEEQTYLTAYLDSKGPNIML